MTEERSEIPARAYSSEMAADRRASARVPLDRPVRIGPPGGRPYATVSARDFSVGGLFIDSEREVRVGARFAVEIPVSDVERAYISVAEVVDNRSSTKGSGFGVRFIEMSDESRDLLESTISARIYVPLRSEPDDGEPTGFDIPPGSVLPNRAEAELGGDVEPRTFGDEPRVSKLTSRLGDESSPSPGPVYGPMYELDVEARGVTPTLVSRARDRWSKLKAWVRSLSLISGVSYVMAALAVMAAGLLVMFDGPLQAGDVFVEARRTLTPDVHERLAGRSEPKGISEIPSPIKMSGRSVNPLPNKDSFRLASLMGRNSEADTSSNEGGETFAAARQADLGRPRGDSLEERNVSRRSTVESRPSPKSDAPALADPKPSLPRDHTDDVPKVAEPTNQSPKPAPSPFSQEKIRQVEEQNWEIAKRYVSDCKGGDGEYDYYDKGYGDYYDRHERYDEYEFEGRRRRHRCRRGDCSRGRRNCCFGSRHVRRVTVHLAERDAHVRKHYVLRRPNRFVIDVEKLHRPPRDAPRHGRGAIKRIRFGRHYYYDRFVVDTYDPIYRAHANVCRNRLELALFFH